jgi:ubiquinone/menaquinone biosynthesis C-methylase UbiE
MATDAKREAQRQWGSDPSGAWASEAEPGTPEFFAEVDEARYRRDPWLFDLFDWIAEGRVLEIGCGLGADLEQISRRGAEVVGIDLTPECVALAERRFELRGLHGEFVRGDAEALPFDDASFDGVYSVGVLHHVPDVARAVGEIRRVVRPGGRALVAVYHRNSWFYRVNIQLIERLLHGGWRREALEQRLSRIEHRSSDNDAFPLVTLFSRAEMRKLFSSFPCVQLRVDHLRRDELPGFLGRRLSAEG